jgi:hypothetical protein
MRERKELDMSHVAINPFVRRQTAASQFSHYEGSWEKLAELVEAHLDQAKPGYMDGVKLVPVPADGFYAGVVALTAETPLQAVYAARREGEEPYVEIRASAAAKQPAAAVDIVIYSHDVLAADGDASSDAPWEVISVNAKLTEGDEPLSPMAMARNFLGLPGGSQGAEYTAEDFAKAIVYWSQHAMCAPLEGK